MTEKDAFIGAEFTGTKEVSENLKFDKDKFQQWIDANKAPHPLIQPATNNTPATSVSTDMSGLLDDLDF